jgi:hypothetical protein
MTASINSRAIQPVRWIARIWSLLTALLVLMVALGRDSQGGGGPVPLIEWLLLSLYAVAALGLLLAWRWEALGGWLAIGCMLVEIFGFRLVKGMWYPNYVGFAVPLVLFVLPGIFFVVSSAMSHRRAALVA